MVGACSLVLHLPFGLKEQRVIGNLADVKLSRYKLRFRVYDMAGHCHYRSSWESKLPESQVTMLLFLLLAANNIFACRQSYL